MATMPTLTDSGQRLYDSVAPLAAQDPQNGYALANYIAALAAMVDPVANIVRDPDDGDTYTVPGWAKLFDVNNVDPSWLPWLAQFVGTNLTGVTDVQAQRNLIKSPVGYQRGTVAAMVARAQPTLTGAQTVIVQERVSGNPWAMNVHTYANETPNAALTLQALRSMKRAGIVLTYTVVVGGTYGQLAAAHTTYSAMKAAHTTYSDLPANPGA